MKLPNLWKLKYVAVVLGVVASAALVPTAAQAAGFTTTLVNRWKGKCLDAEASSNFNGSKVQLWDCNGWSNQEWRLVPTTPDNHLYQIINVKFNRCLDARAQDITHDGTKVQLWDCLYTAGHPVENQTWYQNDLNQGTTFENYGATNIRNDTASVVLDGDSNNPNNGANVQLWRFLNTSNQYWYYGAL